jgi:hypothetical protein
LNGCGEITNRGHFGNCDQHTAIDLLMILEGIIRPLSRIHELLNSCLHIAKNSPIGRRDLGGINGNDTIEFLRRNQALDQEQEDQQVIRSL